MSEVDSAAPVAPVDASAGDSFSKEYVEQLKAQIAEKTRNEAVLKAKFAGHEQRQRAMLSEMQPTVQEWIKEGLDHGTMEDKHVMGPMSDFGANLHQADNLDSAMPLARMITVHSARFKRKSEEFSQSAGAAEQLGRVNKELEEIKADRDAKTARIGELEGLVNEHQGSLEALQEELAKHGHIKQQFDFSNSSSREAKGAGSSTGAMSASAAAAQPFVDPLLSYVQKNGGGGGRIGLSATGHHVLGAGGAGDSSLQAALRVA